MNVENLTSWINVPPWESVPVKGACQNTGQRYTKPNLFECDSFSNSSSSVAAYVLVGISVSVRAGVVAATVVGIARIRVTVQVFVVCDNGAVPAARVCTKPRSVPCR